MPDDALVHRHIRHGWRAAVRQRAQLLPCARIGQGQAAQWLLRIGDHHPQQRQQTGADRGHAGGIELRLVVAVMQGQRRVLHDGQGQRITGLLAPLDGGKYQTIGRRPGQGFVDRIVFKHHQGVEQAARTLLGPALDVDQRRVLMFARGQALRLHLGQPAGHRLRMARRGDHGQRVDEQSQQLLRAGQVAGPPGHRGAKGHRALARMALQQDRPRRLHDGVDRHMVAPRKGGQLHAFLALQRRADFRMPALPRLARQQPGQARGRGQRRHQRAPVAFAAGRVLPLQPGDVVAVASAVRGQRLARIVAQQLAHQARTAPAIEQQMVVGPDEMVA
ncbi:hypothetical protein JALI103349_29120 [Janthinobacterium lividum]